VIRGSRLTLRRGAKVLLESADLVVHPGERIGVVGKNGAGKSSLFALLTGDLDLDAGDLSLPAGWRTVTVQQEIAADERPAREFVIDGDVLLRELQHRRAALNESEGKGGEIAELEAALVEAGAWSAASRAEQLLSGLGFKPEEWQQPAATFSGGWRMRLALARALMAPSDLLLLDEPTNHLDLDAMLWLEKWLAAYAGTVLLISHDTEFLDAVAKSILHFEASKLIRYRGGYQDFLTQRAERLRQTHIAYSRQTREAARLRSFIDRFKAKASKAKQAQSRVKALARMEALAPLQAEAGIEIRIPSPALLPDPLLTLEGLSAGYTTAQGNAVPILRDITLGVPAGSRIGILGANGAGKSTFIKTLAEALPPLAGIRRASRGLAIGYFHQHQLDMLDPDNTPLAHLARIAPDAREQALRNYLGGFGFSGDSVISKVGPMSGGEKARLALSLIVWQKPNLLLLDEPSNHLDVATREALATALAEFAGSMLLVSHDRHLLRTTVDSFWIVADGSVQEFQGDLEDYREWLATRSITARTTPRPGAQANGDRKQQRRQEAQERQRLAASRQPLEQRLAEVETQMNQAQARMQTLDAVIADPDLYSDARRAERQAIMAEHGELAKRVDKMADIWLDIQESLESLTSPLPKGL
jgi:ATP-binding cassette subfamily F protein 3